MPSPYRVVYSQANREKLLEFGALAFQQGSAKAYLDSVAAIDRILHDSPLDFGEGLYSLADAHLHVRHGIVSPLVVYWAVHEEKAVVFVQDFRLLPDFKNP
jgi:hypothetical protein